MTRLARALAAGACLTAWLLAAPAATALGPEPRAEERPFGEDTHALRRILFLHNMAPLAGPNDVRDAGRTVIIVLGETAPLEQLEKRFGRGWLRKFVADGGALMVATDRASSPALANNFGVGVAGGELLRLSEVGPAAYQGVAACPFLRGLPGARPALFQPPTLPRGETAAVAANLPSQLEFTSRKLPGEVDVLASLPRGCTDGTTRYGLFTPPFAVGGELGRGKLLILADHSVFINDMMVQPDNGNLAFGFRCADWLREGNDDRRRDRVLFYDEGAARTDLDVPVKPLPVPPIPPVEGLLPLVDETLHGLERENAFNRTLLHYVDPEQVWQGVAVVLSVLLALYGFVRLGLFRQRHDTSSPTLARALERQALTGAALERRYDELLREGNLWEAARALARQLFEEAGAGAEGPPAVAARGGWWRRWRWERRVRHLWAVAHAAPVHVSPRRFAALVAEVKEVRAALADGTLRIR
jgi:hypothetical protein